jgi:hypothetical protein
MITTAYLVSRAIKMAADARRLLRRVMRVLVTARMRRVQQEIELHRRFGA